jgi:hypothetical protein
MPGGRSEGGGRDDAGPGALTLAGVSRRGRELAAGGRRAAHVGGRSPAREAARSGCPIQAERQGARWASAGQRRAAGLLAAGLLAAAPLAAASSQHAPLQQAPSPSWHCFRRQRRHQRISWRVSCASAGASTSVGQA